MTVTIHKKRPSWAQPLGTMVFVPVARKSTDSATDSSQTSLKAVDSNNREETISEAMERSMTELANKVQAEILAEQQQATGSCKPTETISEAMERSVSALLDKWEADDAAIQSSATDSPEKG